MDSQGDMFPFASPETVLAHCRRLEARVLAIAPEMDKQDCNGMLAELALADLMLDAIDRRIRQGPEYLERTRLPVPAKLLVIDGGAAPRSWRQRNKRRRSTPAYSPS